MDSKEDPLDEHRKYIDRIDKTIVALLEERLRRGYALGKVKRAHHHPTRSPEREARVLDNVRLAAQGHLSPSSAERIFTLIIEETSAVQRDR
jgi:chorismate mutase